MLLLTNIAKSALLKDAKKLNKLGKLRHHSNFCTEKQK